MNEVSGVHLTGALLRRLAFWGARYGPRWWLRYSPGPIGRLIAHARPTWRARVRELHQWCAPGADTDLEAHLFANYAHCLAEGLSLPRGLAPVVEVEGEQLPTTDGVVFVTAHTGSWEIAGASLARRLGRPVSIVMQPEPDADARALHERIRQDWAVRTVYVGEQAEVGVRLLHEVRRGGCLAFQIDRAAPSGRCFAVNLYGRRFEIPQGPFRIARLCRVPVVPVFNARIGFMKYRVRIYPHRLIEADSPSSAARDAAQYSADCLADFIGSYPGQWFHFGGAPPPSR